MAERGQGWRGLTMLAVATVFTTAGMMLGRRTPQAETAGASVRGAGVTGRGRPSHPVSRKARRDGFEPKDMSASGVAKIIAGWFTLVLVAIVGLWGLRQLYISFDHAEAPPVTAQTGAPMPPPAPRLQADPPRDLASLRNYEAHVLYNYATIPGDPAHVHIPITEAMQRTIGHSLDPPPAGKPNPGAHP